MRNRLKRMTIPFLLLLVMTGYKGMTQDSLQLTLQEALQMTYRNSPVIKESEYQQKEKEMQRKAAWGKHLPQLTINGNYQYMSDDIELDLNRVKGAITPLYQTLGNYGDFSDVPNPDPQTNDEMPILPDQQSTQVIREQFLSTARRLQSQDWTQTIQESEFATVHAKFKWPVFTGGKIRSANKAGEIREREAATKGRHKKNQLTSELINHYYGVRLARDAVQVRQEVMNVMKAHLREANRMFEEGMVAQAQLLHAKVYHAEAQRKLKKARRKYTIAQKALKNTMAFDENVIIQPSSKLFYLKELKDAAEFKTLAKRSSPILKQISLNKKLVHQDYKSKKSDYYPKAAITGMYDLYNKDLSPQLPEWMVGISLQWNLFDGLARTRKVQAAKFKEKQIQQIHIKTENDLQTAIDKLYRELLMNVEQLRELDVSRKHAREYLRVSQKSFREGMATSSDVTEASASLSKVRIERLQVMYDYVKTLAKLLEITGNSDKFTAYLQSKKTIYESHNK
ncbi:MAG: TolC family protein [Bacteroidales bacterium]|nr:TolC family protein [Bacteroidales bacterium]MCF8333170.1 TolC family protein [Bacteroidales bacterium]